MYRFARRPRWIAIHVLVLVVTGLFVVAGLWQLDRLDQRRERNALIEQRRSAPLVELGELLGSPSEVEHRRVAATGAYDTSEEVLLSGRTLRGKPGSHVLTPLVVDGRAVIVDRGWVPIGRETPPIQGAEPPEGDVEVEGVLLPSEGGAFTGERPAESLDAMSRIDVQRLAAQLPYPTYSVYLLLAAQRPPQPDGLPEFPELPERSDGPHLYYAIQWFLFAVIAIVGYAAILRREGSRDTELDTRQARGETRQQAY